MLASRLSCVRRLPFSPSHTLPLPPRLWSFNNPAVRLREQNRKYPEAKLQENLDAEIMEVLLQEARDAYAPEVVVELRSDTAAEMDENVDRVVAWLEQWRRDNGVVDG